MSQLDILKVVKKNPAILRANIFKKLGLTWNDSKQINSLLRKGLITDKWAAGRMDRKQFWITEEGKRYIREAEASLKC